MASIKAIATDETMLPAYRLTGVMMSSWASPGTSGRPRSTRRAITLPAGQWQEACGMLASGVALDPIAGVNLGLSG